MTPRVTRIMGVGALVGVLLLAAGCGGSAPGTGAAGAAAVEQAQSKPAPAATGTVDYGTHKTDTRPKTPLRKGEKFMTLYMQNAYTPNPPEHGTDDYRCFVIDPKLTRKTFLTGNQFLPDNAGIVHHAIFFKLEKKDVPQARELDAKAPGDGYTCFSGTGIGGPQGQLRGAPWLAAWAPGGGENLAAKGTGNLMNPGDQVIMQVHYNLLATGGKATASDKSGIRLRLAPGNAKLEPLSTTLLPAPVELPCPKGETGQLCDRDMSAFDEIRRFGDEAGYTIAGLNLICNNGAKPKPGNTQHCDRKARQTMVVQAVAGHMHLLGRSIKVELNPGTKKAKTLLDVPVYDFDNQGARMLKKPVTVKSGDTLRVTCTHDAGLRSQLPSLRTLKPRYVLWGEGTSDEMCLGVVIWSAKAAA
jgi:copper type II ascorbate-dependent monooxygenase-like protein